MTVHCHAVWTVQCLRYLWMAHGAGARGFANICGPGVFGWHRRSRMWLSPAARKFAPSVWKTLESKAKDVSPEMFSSGEIESHLCRSRKSWCSQILPYPHFRNRSEELPGTLQMICHTLCWHSITLVQVCHYTTPFSWGEAAGFPHTQQSPHISHYRCLLTAWCNLHSWQGCYIVL